ncbi:MAG: AraC family transcriptional regulator [Lachnospiraceae bacterium]
MAQKTFFYPLCAGHYFCNQNYRVVRDNYDSYLLLYVIKGSGYIELNGEKHSIAPNQFALIDCYYPHIYGSCSDSFEFFWFHFDGSSSHEYTQVILQTFGSVISLQNNLQHQKHLQNILSNIGSTNMHHEALLSKYILLILTDILTYNAACPNTSLQMNPIEETIQYISSHIQEELSIQELAKRANLSPYYFIRVFKKETGYTPHEFVLNSRISMAKLYLKSYPLSIKEVGFLCGFSSESGFCTTFKRMVGNKPSDFRSNNTS